MVRLAAPGERRRRGRSRALAASSIALLLCRLLNGQESAPASITVQQVAVNLPSIRVYMDVAQADGKPLVNVKSGDFKANVAGEWLPFKSVRYFESTGEGVAYIVLIDTSQSIPPKRFGEMRDAVTLLISKMDATDRMALLTIGATVTTIQPFTRSQAELTAALNAINPVDNRTALYAALIEAIRSGQAVPTNVPGRRAIIVLTDGMDDDDATGHNEVDVMRAIEDGPVPIYAIGVTAVPPKASAEEALKVLAEFARASSGLYRPLGSAPIASVYEEMRQAIRNVYVGEITCATCPRDGLRHALKINVRGAESVPMQIELIASLIPPVQTGMTGTMRASLIAGAVIIVLAAAGLVFWLFRKRRASPMPPVVPAPDPLSYYPPNPVSARQPGMRIVLAVIGKQAEYQLELARGVVIGRGPQCQICLDSDTDVADRHCEIYKLDGEIFIRELENGALIAINGVPILHPRRLANNDIIRVGGTELRIAFPAMA